MSIDAAEILRRLVLSATDDYDAAISKVLRAAVDEVHIAWAHVNGRTLSVYCYTQRDGERLKREFGGNTFKPITQRGENYWIWQWEAPYGNR